MSRVDGNVAFKVTWVYGGKGPFTTACTAMGRGINIAKVGKVWCSAPENRCSKVFKAGNVGGPVAFNESNYPCNDVMVFRKWAFSSGWFHHGNRKGSPIPMRHAKPGKLAFITSRPYDLSEAERLVIGCFQIGSVGEVDDEVWVQADSKGERIRIRDLGRAPKYWDYYTQGGGPRWGTGLFRYLPDSTAALLHDAVRRAAR